MHHTSLPLSFWLTSTLPEALAIGIVMRGWRWGTDECSTVVEIQIQPDPLLLTWSVGSGIWDHGTKMQFWVQEPINSKDTAKLSQKTAPVKLKLMKTLKARLQATMTKRHRGGRVRRYSKEGGLIVLAKYICEPSMSNSATNPSINLYKYMRPNRL